MVLGLEARLMKASEEEVVAIADLVSVVLYFLIGIHLPVSLSRFRKG